MWTTSTDNINRIAMDMHTLHSNDVGHRVLTQIQCGQHQQISHGCAHPAQQQHPTTTDDTRHTCVSKHSTDNNTTKAFALSAQQLATRALLSHASHSHKTQGTRIAWLLMYQLQAYAGGDNLIAAVCARARQPVHTIS
jgi:hypothetical protein